MRQAYPAATSGWYQIKLSTGRVISMWCNCATNDAAWTVVWSNFRGGSKPTTNLAWTNAINGVYTFRSNVAAINLQANNPEDIGVYTGLALWAGLAPRGRLRYDWATDYGQPLQQSYECSYTLTGANYVISVTSCVQRLGSVVPGIAGTHNNQPFTATDVKNNIYAQNCANQFSGSPWWYVQCWDGSINGGGETGQGGYYNGAYWLGAAPQWAAAGGVGAGNGWILLS
eukprot:TRINITY_DN3269_c0_g1_i3.p1 TRINITY_DN3269_c0_g1~~TRINITY_DN3269_c0_g1_i3.p1  ORF type:complete len:228 (+),score=51.75 TRINITY_DN3269_c0_g1_i3:1080-1763(+)